MNKLISIALLLCLQLVFGSIWCQNNTYLVIESAGHSGRINGINAIAGTPYFISVSDDKTIRVWNTKTANLIQTYRPAIGHGNEGQILCADVSPDGKLLAFACASVDFPHNGIYFNLLDLQSGQIEACFHGHSNYINTIRFSKDGKKLISGSKDNTLKIWKVPDFTGEGATVITQCLSTLYGHTQEINQAEFIDANHIISVSSDSTARIWTLKADTAFSSLSISKHKSEIFCEAVSPDGKYIATGGADGFAYLWDNKGNLIRQLDLLANSVNALSISPDSKKIVVVSGANPERNAYIFDLVDGRKTSVFTGHTNTVKSVLFVNDTLVISASEFNIYQWNPNNGELFSDCSGKGQRVYSIAYGKGMKIAFGNSLFTGNISSLNKNPLEKIFSFSDFYLKEGFVDETEFHKATMAEKIIQPDGPNGEFLFYGNPIIPGASDGNIRCYTLTPDSNLVVGFDFSLKEFNRFGGIVGEYVGHTGSVRALTVTPDGRMLISCSDDQTIRLWTREKLPISFRLTAVRKGGLAESSGLKQGDEILGVDSMLYYSESELNPSIAEKRLYQFHIRRDGNEMDIEINKTGNAFGFSRIPVFENLLASLFVSADNEWVCWTPLGYFAASAHGDKYIGWQINQGIDSLSAYYSASQFFDQYYQPDFLRKVIATCKTDHQLQKMQKQKMGNMTAMLRSIPDIAISLAGSANDQRGIQLGTTTGNIINSASGTVEISVRVTDKGGGIDEVRLYQNEKLVASEYLQSGNSNSPGETIKMVFTVDLADGDNTIRATAFNRDRSEALSNELTIAWQGVKAEASLYLICIGINEYANEQYSLNYALPDAKSFVEAIEKGTTGIFDHVYIQFLKDSKAVKDSIDVAFQEVVSKAGPQDVFMFYYAGHGVMSEGSATEKPMFYIIPH
ncbi:MAG: caspase family protein, partial [Bacteroidetes bacterium]|nr:caspase family protein [Bacteroidota bacterium]